MMGIRVHKSLGYGVDNIKCMKKSQGSYSVMADPRIDRPKFDALHEKAHEMEGPELLRWLKKEKDGLVAFHAKHNPGRMSVKDNDFYEFDWKFLYQSLDRAIKDKKSGDISFGSSIIHEGEFGLPEVLLFVPPTCPSWTRYDDTLDYHEETYIREEGQINWYKFLRCSGIYPWSGRMIRYRDPKPGVLNKGSNPDDLKLLDATTYSQLVGWWDSKHKPDAEGAALKHLKEDYRPAFPIDLMVLLWFMRDAFRNIDEFVNELRPMIYVYWG
jgi:hypothetical protein